MILSTHLIDEAADLLEHVVLLDRGRVLLEADAEALRQFAVTKLIHVFHGVVSPCRVCTACISANSASVAAASSGSTMPMA